MWRNYLKVAFRNLRKQKLYAIINVLGLAIGLAFCCLVLLFIRYELSFDQFHTNKDRIYHLYQTYYYPDGSAEDVYDDQPAPLGEVLQADFPEVEQYVRFSNVSGVVSKGVEVFNEDLLFVDPAFFDVFSFPLLAGNKSTALLEQNNIVLSEDMAVKYFGDSNPIGQPLSIRVRGDFVEYSVAGVAKQPPANSSIAFDILLPFGRSPMFEQTVGNWGWHSFPTFIQLAPGADAEALAMKLPAFWRVHNQEEWDELQQEGWPEGQPYAEYNIQAIGDMHLNTSVESDLIASRESLSLFIMAGIAIAILLIACINFMTLALGRSTRRSQEVGVRKVIGARRAQLLTQFWGEAVLLSSFAAIFGLLLSYLVLPVFNHLVDVELVLDILNDPFLAAFFLLTALLSAFLAGSYPALVLSNMVPVIALKNQQKLGGRNLMTQSLVTAQFGVSVFLFISTLVMLQQLRHINQKDLGFNDEEMVVISTQRLDSERLMAFFKDRLEGNPAIVGITGIQNSFQRGYWSNEWRHLEEDKEAYIYPVEHSFVEIMKMELIEGRSFSEALASDSNSVIVNEALVRDFGWKDPLNQRLTGLTLIGAKDPQVIGVVKDFNYRSLHQPIEPVVMLAGNVNNLLVRIQPHDVPTTLATLEETWSEFAPGIPYSFSFMDEDLQEAYNLDKKWSQIVGYASLLAILVACMGLFGLAALTVAGRMKEIGIRKVLGASVANVITLVSKDFALLVILGIVISVPIAYYVMQQWLEGFAYRITLGPSVFIIACITALGIAVLTVSYQSVKAALSNPVDSLARE
ncbi:MAG: ABC transporter permease [Rhodothermaceae bacterium]|nr:ABC transporter permease [Rhodothermaceae bacterium]